MAGMGINSKFCCCVLEKSLNSNDGLDSFEHKLAMFLVFKQFSLPYISARIQTLHGIDSI